MRLFIALPLPPDVVRTLQSAQEALKTISSGGRYVPRENFHITMHFIGESHALREAAAAVDAAVRGIRPFILRLNGFSSFVRAKSHTAFVDLSGDMRELYILHEALSAALMDNGFPAGKKRLLPHITLARDVSLDKPDALSALKIEAEGGAAFTANQLVLYESRRQGQAIAYAPLHRAMLF